MQRGDRVVVVKDLEHEDDPGGSEVLGRTGFISGTWVDDQGSERLTVNFINPEPWAPEAAAMLPSELVLASEFGPQHPLYAVLYPYWH